MDTVLDTVAFKSLKALTIKNLSNGTDFKRPLDVKFNDRSAESWAILFQHAMLNRNDFSVEYDEGKSEADVESGKQYSRSALNSMAMPKLRDIAKNLGVMEHDKCDIVDGILKVQEQKENQKKG